MQEQNKPMSSLEHTKWNCKYHTKMSILRFTGYLKVKSSLMIFQRFGNMKFGYKNREFWCKDYYVDTAEKNTKAIKGYIKNQLKQDR